jgi:phospholipid transport system transporter-binding protein
VNSTGLHAAGNGCFQVTGPVVFATAGSLLASSHDLFAGTGPIRVDLAGVTRVDSSALALLIEWLRLARFGGREISFEGIPEKLRSIARLCGVEDMIVAPAD